MSCSTDTGVCISTDAWLNHYKAIFCDLYLCESLEFESFALISHLQLFLEICLSSSVLIHDSFLCGSVNSTLKCGKNPLNCNSYRPITVACNLIKTFEYVLLSHIYTNCVFYVNQFRFKSSAGCQYAHRGIATL